MHRHVLETLRQSAPIVLPSMLLCDFGNLEREIGRLEEAGFQGLHLDVMDGVFVQNFTYGITLVSAFRKLTKLPLDVHLMIQDPVKYVDEFAAAGADIITFHVEATTDPMAVIDRIHANHLPAGIALNSKTPINRIEKFLPKCQMALVMSIEAGFGGQAFDDSVLPKFHAIRALVGEEIVLEVDGGVNPSTAGRSVENGAELLVVGSAIFKKDNYATALAELTSEIAKAKC